MGRANVLIQYVDRERQSETQPTIGFGQKLYIPITVNLTELSLVGGLSKPDLYVFIGVSNPSNKRTSP